MSDTPHSLLAQLAERAATHPKLEGAVMGAVRATLPGVIQSVLRELFPGETVRLYVPKIGDEHRAARAAQVMAALNAGTPAAEVARLTGVPVRTVRHMRQRRGKIGGGNSPP